MLLLVPFVRGLLLGGGLFLAAQTLACRALGLRGVLQLRDARTGAVAPLRKALAARGCGVAAAYLLSAGFIALGYGLLDVPTARIRAVPGLPAERAGLRDGDLVVEADGAPVRDFATLREHIQARRPAGTPLQLTVERAGARLTLPVVPGPEGVIGVQVSGESVRTSPSAALTEGLTAPVRLLPGWGRVLAALGDTGPDAPRVVTTAGLAAVAMKQGRAAMIFTGLGFEFTLLWPLALLLSAVLTLAERKRGPQPRSSSSPV